MKLIKYYTQKCTYDDAGRVDNDRESYVLIADARSVEGWRTRMSGLDGELMYSAAHPTGYVGGIEIHSPTPLYEGQEPMHLNCNYTKDGICYHDGSSLAFEAIERLFDNPAAMFRELAAWFGEDEDAVLAELDKAGE